MGTSQCTHTHTHTHAHIHTQRQREREGRRGEHTNREGDRERERNGRTFFQRNPTVRVGHSTLCAVPRDHRVPPTQHAIRHKTGAQTGAHFNNTHGWWCATAHAVQHSPPSGAYMVMTTTPTRSGTMQKRSTHWMQQTNGPICTNRAVPEETHEVVG